MDNSFTDPRDGQTYRTVKIGGLVWMAENLNYKPGLFSSGKSWCYNNDDSYSALYGRLYDWKTAKKACPKGWHLPSREEWNKLVEAAGGGKVAGKKLKSKTGWNKNGNGTDEFGFSALPGSSRLYSTGGFDIVGSFGFWWSATECGGGKAYSRRMDYDDNVPENSYGVRLGCSVRCVHN